jgi:CBS domain containing-hemolysin-like protein
MDLLERIPREADHFGWQGCHLEVVDRDGKRGDKLLVTPWDPRQPDL